MLHSQLLCALPSSELSMDASNFSFSMKSNIFVINTEKSSVEATVCLIYVL